MAVWQKLKAIELSTHSKSVFHIALLSTKKISKGSDQELKNKDHPIMYVFCVVLVKKYFNNNMATSYTYNLKTKIIYVLIYSDVVCFFQVTVSDTVYSNFTIAVIILIDNNTNVVHCWLY